MAMLGKQGWCLISNLESLLARSLKARYFPRHDFMHSTKGFNPSYYSWRSIFKANVLLEKGFRWRVGDGQNIQIWQAKWIHGQFDYYTPSGDNNHDQDLRVSDLMMEGHQV